MIDLDLAPPVVARRRASSRSPLPSLAALVLVLLLGASGPVARPAPTTIIPAAQRGDTFVDGDRLFVTGPVEGRLRIYRLPDGHALGQIDTGYPGTISGVRRIGDTLLVSVTVPRVTVAVDAVSGRRLWAYPAGVSSVSPAMVVLADDLATWAADPRTGRTRWRIDQPVFGSRYLVSAGLDTMTSFDGTTGRRLATGPLHLSGLIYSYISDTLFAIGDASGLSAYELPSLKLRWHLDITASSLDPTCVRVLCSSSPNDPKVTVRDPATGRTLFSSPRWATVAQLGPSVVAAADPGPLDSVRLYLLDPATGALTGDFGNWRIIEPGYALYPATAPNDYWLGTFAPTHAAVRVLGEVSQMAGKPLIGANALVYHRIDGSIAIQRFG